jgi:hypothetical protein
MGAERRQHARVDVRWKARVAWPGKGIADGRVRNVSRSGMFMETPVPAGDGELLLVELEAVVGVNTRLVRVKAKVMHRALQGQSIFGYGMLFETISDDDQQFLNGFVERNS